MHISTQTPIWGIEDRVLQWSASERKTLERAQAILAQAREAVGPDTDLGTDLGKGETILWEYGEGVHIDTRNVPLRVMQSTREVPMKQETKQTQPPDLEEADRGVLHRAGLGMFRPTASKTVARVDRLISAGLLARNPQTGIVFLTKAGDAALD